MYTCVTCLPRSRAQGCARAFQPRPLVRCTLTLDPAPRNTPLYLELIPHLQLRPLVRKPPAPRGVVAAKLTPS